ncbi:MAG: ribonuclease D, partial [Rhodospirillales bacterium]
MQLITDTDALRAFCSQFAEDPFIAVDTEFMRERTFWPKLCLVQVAGPSAAAAIDPLADGIDLAPLLALLRRPEIVKVFHAARQDLEIFYQLLGELPAPVFDTQVAAMVCGFGDQVGYETLAARLARAKLDKASRFTDWSVRPLSQRQIEYALSDVTHLREIYRKLKRKLETSRRSEWLAEEMATLTDPATYRVDPMEAYRRLKTRVGNGRFLAILREVAA